MQVYRPKQPRVMGRISEDRVERRSRQRYPLRLPMWYAILRKRSEHIPGETLDITSKSLSFMAAEPIPVRTGLEILIDWPVAAPHGGELKLELLARAIRCDVNLVAAEIRSHRLVESRPGEDYPKRKRPEYALK